MGRKLAKLIAPPLLIELVGDLGGGKTTLVKAIADGLGVGQTVVSPTFNIHRSYVGSNNIKLEHFDLYRLSSDGVVQNELIECLEDPRAIVCVEWANNLMQYESLDRLVVGCYYVTENERQYVFKANGKKSIGILNGLSQ